MLDVAVIGGGISGLMAAERLTTASPALKVAVFEKGRALADRYCPVVERGQACAHCSPCAIMEGEAGAGAFSDGKYVISTEYGGWLTDILPQNVVMDYIEQADAILCSYGAPTDRFMPDDELKTMCIRHDLHMQQGQLKHLGTDNNLATMGRLIASLSERADIRRETAVTNVDKDAMELTYSTKGGPPRTEKAKHILFAVGRSGSEFFQQWCRDNGLPLHNNQIDIGVRVELPSLIWEHFSKRVYEPKIWYRSKLYGDITRMFCFNERGYVVTENTGGILTVNGHAYKSLSRKSENSNFALLSTLRFTQPFSEPIRYAKNIATLANQLSGGGVLVQRLGDLEAGRRSNEQRIKSSTTRPTLNAVPGDLSLCLPKRQLDNIIETLHALESVAPGTANHDVLLYGIECKYYSSRPACNDFELDGCPNIYTAGDGSGFTRSLSHAAANGLYVGDKLIARLR